MAKIHPTSIIEGDVTLAEDVVVGPWCHLLGTLGPITIGPGTVLQARVQLEGPLTIGSNNSIGTNTCIGCAPQDLGTPADFPGKGIIIGSKNVFREGVTISRPKMDQPGRIGDQNYWMANSHAGHDCIVGNNTVFANGTLLAGHVEVADRVMTGGAAGIHQFVRLGRGCFISGLAGASYDVCPFFLVTATNYARGLNIVGMRRSGISSAAIDSARWAYATLCRSRLLPKNALDLLRNRAGDPMIDEYIAFVEGSKRGIVHTHGRRSSAE